MPLIEQQQRILQDIRAKQTWYKMDEQGNYPRSGQDAGALLAMIDILQADVDALELKLRNTVKIHYAGRFIPNDMDVEPDFYDLD